MNIKRRTASVSTSLNVGLTIGKFLMYFFTGSLAILAEAWHSLTDIFTSLMVYVSISLPGQKSPGQKEEPVETPSSPPRSAWHRIPLEVRISFFIGLFILAAAVSVVRKVIVAPTPEITSPVAAGLIFILFALGSYIVYKFEVKIGKEQNSAALIADGLHSKADMVGALLAGFSLILHQIGLNLDKLTAYIISVFIFSFAAETFINFGRAWRGKTGWEEKPIISLITASLEKENWTALSHWLCRQLNLEHISPSWGVRIKGAFRVVILIVLLLIVTFSSFFLVNPSEEAIRERLGKPLDSAKPLGPGLHWKLPWPLDKVIKIDSRTIRSMNIGNITAPRAVALLWTREHGTEQSFLSGDNNLFYPYLVLHYRIKDIFAYLYHHENPEEFLDHSTHRLITKIFSQKDFYGIATGYRQEAEKLIKNSIQEEMNKLKTGIEIISLNTKDIHPPVSIADSYEQVIAALQEKEEKINQAKGYQNSALPEARSWATRSRARAQAFVDKQVNTAWGDSGKFILIHHAFQPFAELAAQFLRLQALREALTDKRLILVDPASGVPEVWLKQEGGPSLFAE